MLDNKRIALVLGGTNPHITLIRKLKERGYYTILVDYLPSSPAKEYADMHIMESTLDKEKVLEIAEICNASLVITTNIDQANVTACYVAEKLNLPHPYSYETALDVTKKDRMKRIMSANDISTSRFIVAENPEDARSLNYPVIVKPTDSNGSRGVHRCNSYNEYVSFFPMAKDASRTGNVIVEEFVDGVEVSYYYFIQDYEPHYITSNERFKYKSDDAGVIQSAGGIYPALRSKEVFEKMDEIARKIALAFDLKNTPLFIQGIVKDEDVFVIEFAPRIGGGLSFRLIERDNEFDIIGAAINSFLGEQSKMDMIQPDYYSATMNIYAPGITVGNISGLDQVIRSKAAKEFHQYKLKGTEVSADMSSGSRVGCFFIQGDNVEEVRKRIRYVNETLEVYDEDGSPSMRHNIYQSLE